jgi:hypothetical protein
MSCFSNQYDRLGGGKRLIRLLPLLMALLAAPTVVFAQQGDNEQGKANDPTGAWLVADTGAGSDGQPLEATSSCADCLAETSETEV